MDVVVGTMDAAAMVDDFTTFGLAFLEQNQKSQNRKTNGSLWSS
jgi:hypothetical protein